MRITEDRYGYIQDGMWKKIHHPLTISFLSLSFVLIEWSFLPAQGMVEIQTIQPGLMG
jgi:hypothetical protein